MNISQLKDDGLKSIYIITSFVLFILFVLFLLSKRFFNPYFKLYKNLKNSIDDAKNGNFKTIKIPNGLNKESKQITEDYNSLIDIVKDTISNIDSKLQGFIDYREKNETYSNPLTESRNIIDNLSDLYQFKKHVELDDSKQEIYTRLSEVFENKFKIENFSFFEIDNKKHKIDKIISKGKSLYCEDAIKNNPENCRASRTKNDVFSVNYHNSCPYFNKEDKYYYCININITKENILIIHITCDTQEEIEDIKHKSQFIKRYLKEAAPVIEVKLLMEALQESAYQDGLTGLYNRKYLDETIKKLVPQVKRSEKSIGLLMLDMDHFKAVNDEYGHDIGDKVLKELANILTDTVRESDIIVRYGGEEFMVLLIGVNSEEDALSVAHKIGTRVRENEIDVYAGTTIQKTVSIGLSMFPQDSTNFDTIIKNADIALYEAKSSGRDKVVRFKKEQLNDVELF